MGLSPEEVDRLPWWQRRLFAEHMNEEFKPLDQHSESPGPMEHAEPRSYGDSIPEPQTRVLTAEEEERAKRQHERFMKAAPVPGYGAADLSALEAAGFQVRTVE